MKKSTGELLELIKKSSNFSNYIEQVAEELTDSPSISDCLNAFRTEKGLTKTDIVKHCGLDEHYAYDILGGRGNNPDRDKVLAICLTMQLSIEEVQRFLYTNGFSQLYAKTERDNIILFALQNHLSVMDTNELLYEMEIPLLKLSK